MLSIMFYLIIFITILDILLICIVKYIMFYHRNNTTWFFTSMYELLHMILYNNIKDYKEILLFIKNNKTILMLNK